MYYDLFIDDKTLRIEELIDGEKIILIPPNLAYR